MPSSQVVTLGPTGKHMCEGEYESLKAIHAVSPGFVPEPYAWGRYALENSETYFLLAEFRDVGKQVRAPRSAAIDYTYGMKGSCRFPVPVFHRFMIGVQEHIICTVTRSNQFITRLVPLSRSYSANC